jgi:predicted Rossmann-fold nucleotide-binding protein
MPAGMGTFEEFFEVLTWSQLGLHRKACGLLNVLGYYDPFLAMADRAVTEGFLRPAYREMLLAAKDISGLIDAPAQYDAPHVTKWIDRATR